jgi:transcriptional regulator with XRE-family HTH domain
MEIEDDEIAVNIEGLQKFLNDQMHERKMKPIEFAKFLGVSKSTLSRTLNEKNPTVPDYRFLVKIAKATGVDIVSLVALIIPDVTDIDVEARIVAQQIMRLSEDDRRHVIAHITGLLTQTKKAEK